MNHFELGRWRPPAGGPPNCVQNISTRSEFEKMKNCDVMENIQPSISQKKTLHTHQHRLEHVRPAFADASISSIFGE
eukprot:TRINITY_DN158_c0_g3_i1.p1 TRINITY_DN158_c0_g3~~TRINITY_DN158_c0_g3_i1.p1  ORF type:complete len:77 (+),score=2.50 TRINITY_DN158_c0_g3_i1:61-291(+)